MLVSGRVLLEGNFLLMNSQCSASRTGSGKTHTIFGPPGVLTEHEYHQGAVLTKNHMCQGLNSHYFHIIVDGHQPNSRGLYTHYKDSLLKVG